MSLALPPLDGRLTLKGLLGEGGMGQVHRAWDSALERAVAVKFVRSADPREAERLLLEARLQARVEHPNVVRVHEVGALDGRPCIVMQLVEGGTLASLPPETPLAERVSLLQQAALGLHAAHLQGLIHRDVKPGNVLVESPEDGSCRALVSDFGLARDEEGGLTRSGLPAGTLDFMAPEVLLGAGPVDFRVDVYALGATAYALFSGQLPFRTTTGRQADPRSPLPSGQDDGTQLLRRILEEEPAPLQGLPADLRTIITKAMEKAPGDRYASAQALAEDLGRLQAGEPILARRASAFDRLLKWSRRNPTAARASLAATITIFLGLGFGFWTSRRAARQSLEVASLGAEAAEIEAYLRAEQLLPVHDLRPAINHVQEILSDLPRHSRIAPGPAAFVLGRGLQLLGQIEPARVALNRAWELGFRLPAVALALGLAEGQRYAEELSLLPRFEQADQRQARIKALQARFRDPALARLNLAFKGNLQPRPLLAARMALIEERFEDAARLAGEAAGVPAVAAEALELQGTALLEAGLAQYYQGRLPDAVEQLQVAADILRKAGLIARSAQGPRVTLARTEMWLVKIHGLQGVKRLEALAPVDEALREAAQIDPDSASYLTTCAEVESERGRLLTTLGRPSGPAFDAARTYARKAIAIASDPRRPLERLAWISVNIGRELLNSGDQDPKPTWQEGLEAATRAQTLSPESSTPLTLEIQMLSDRSEWDNNHGGDGMADAERAVARARRLVTLDQQPIVARKLAAQALRSLGLCQFRKGLDPEPAFNEAILTAQDAVERAHRDASTLAYGIYTVAAPLEAGLQEGRIAQKALELGTAWADLLLAAQKGDLLVGGQVGEWLFFRAQCESLSNRDPRPMLDQAEALLQPATRIGSASIFWQRLGEIALERAAWAQTHAGSSAPHLAKALSCARRLQLSDPSSSDGPLLEARVRLAQAPADPGQAVALGKRSVQLNAQDAPAWLVLAQAYLAAGNLAPAQEALVRAEALRPRLAGLTALKARLRH